MANLNGWTKWLVATLWGVLVMVVCFMGNVVKANDEKSTSKDEIIIEKIYVGDNKVRKELQDEIALLRNEQKIMRQDMSKGFTEVLVAIAEIKP